MFSDNNRISTRQVFRLFVFDFIGMSTLVLPGVLAQMTGCDGLFAILLGGDVFHLSLVSCKGNEGDGWGSDWLYEKVTSSMAVFLSLCTPDCSLYHRGGIWCICICRRYEKKPCGRGSLYVNPRVDSAGDSICHTIGNRESCACL